MTNNAFVFSAHKMNRTNQLASSTESDCYARRQIQMYRNVGRMPTICLIFKTVIGFRVRVETEKV